MWIAAILIFAAPPPLPRGFACVKSETPGSYGLRLGGAKLGEGTPMRIVSTSGEILSGHLTLTSPKMNDPDMKPNPVDDIDERAIPRATLVLDSRGKSEPSGFCLAVVAAEAARIEVGK